MKTDDNAVTMQWKLVDKGIELSNGYNTIFIPTETLHKMDRALLQKERELGTEQRWYGEYSR